MIEPLMLTLSLVLPLKPITPPLFPPSSPSVERTISLIHDRDRNTPNAVKIKPKDQNDGDHKSPGHSGAFLMQILILLLQVVSQDINHLFNTIT